MVLKKIYLCFVVFVLFSCDDPMLVLDPGKYVKDTENSKTGKNYTNVTNEGKGESDGNTTTIVNNSTWTIEANIYKADTDKVLLKTVHMNARGENYSFYDPSTIVIQYAPIYIEITSYNSQIKANLVTKNYIYFLNK